MSTADVYTNQLSSFSPGQGEARRESRYLTWEGYTLTARFKLL